MDAAASAANDSTWQQIAALRPTLRAHLRIHAHRYRNEPWYVVEDTINNRHHRFDADAFRLIRLLDGEHSIAQIFDVLQAETGHEPPSENEVTALLAHLHAAELLSAGIPPSTESLLKRYRKLNVGRWQRAAMSPMAVRVPLMDPETFLERTHRFVGWMYSPWMWPLWLLLIVTATLLASKESVALANYWQSHALDPRNLLLLWLIYPVMKAVHELGHAYAIKHWGGSVHEFGVVLLVFTPVPYVDASAATAFASKRRRMAVGAAGIIIELLLAAAAMLVWLAVEPGLVRDIAFNVVLIGATSTLLFNGNPLVRFDGYYVLADWLESPNLAARSSQYLGWLVQRHVLRMEGVKAPSHARGERRWFVVYGVSSLIYRTVVLFTIALYVAGKMFFVGIILAAWVIVAQVVKPLYQQLRFILHDPRLAQRRVYACSVVAGALTVILAMLFLLPVPDSTSAQGIVQFPPGAEIRAGTEGIVARFAVADGAAVERDEAILTLDDPFLAAQLKRARWRLEELERLHSRARTVEPTQAQQVAAARDKARAEFDDVNARAQRLIVRSPGNGTVHIARGENLIGRFVRHGDVVARLRSSAPALAHVVIAQDDAHLVRERTRNVQVRVEGALDTVLDARVQREVPSATDQLPSKALGSLGGGTISVDSRDEQGTRSLEQVFELEIALPGDALDFRPGTRVHVRFVHDTQPLGTQWLRQLRLLFLARFQV